MTDSVRLTGWDRYAAKFSTGEVAWTRCPFGGSMLGLLGYLMYIGRLQRKHVVMATVTVARLALPRLKGTPWYADVDRGLALAFWSINEGDAVRSLSETYRGLERITRAAEYDSYTPPGAPSYVLGPYPTSVVNAAHAADAAAEVAYRSHPSNERAMDNVSIHPRAEDAVGVVSDATAAALAGIDEKVSSTHNHRYEEPTKRLTPGLAAAHREIAKAIRRVVPWHVVERALAPASRPTDDDPF